MSIVVPAILARDEQEFRKRAAMIGSMAPMLHIDALDASLFPERSFSDPIRISALHLAIPFGVHLMINHPEAAVRGWIAAGAARIIVHAEAQGDISAAIERVRQAEREAGLALSPETDLKSLEGSIPFVQYVLVMGVHPGAMGRTFDPATIERIRAIKKAHPELIVGVDGGVTAKNHRAHELALAGADELIVGSALWKSSDPLAAYTDIVNDAKL